jgi:hypothetical protein
MIHAVLRSERQIDREGNWERQRSPHIMPCWHRERYRGTAIFILTLEARWGGVVNATPQPYTGLFSHRAGLDGYREENIHFLTGGGGLKPRTVQPAGAGISTTLSRKVMGRTSRRDASITDTHKIAQYDLCHSLPMLHRYFLQFLIFKQRGNVVPDVSNFTAWPSKRCVGRHHYASLLAETNQFGLVQVWVTLDLKQHDLMF